MARTKDSTDRTADEVIVGVDTHKDIHVAVAVAVAVDGLGRRVGTSVHPRPVPA